MKKLVFTFPLYFIGLLAQAQWVLTTPLKEVSKVTTMYFASDTSMLLLDTTSSTSFIGGLYLSESDGSGWKRKNTGVLNDLFMLSDDQGFMLSNGNSIVSTTDRFQNTTFSALGFSNMNELFFIDANVGFCCGANGRIIKTVNGGQAWASTPTGISDLLEDIYFVDSQVGFACSTNGKILKTINQGTTWSTVESAPTSGMRRFLFLNDQLGFALGNVLKKTVDGGNTWTSLSVPPGGFDIKFWNNKLIVSGNSASLFNSTDLGLTWQEMNAPSATGDYYAMAVDQLNRLVLSDEGRLYVSTDGISWNIFLDGIYRSDLIDISFSDADRGAVIGDGSYSSVLYRTENAGRTWIRELVQLGQQNKYKTVSFNSTGGGVTAGELNTPVWISSDYGDNWTPGPSNIPATGSFTSSYIKSNRDFLLGTFTSLSAQGLLMWKAVGGWSQNIATLSQISAISFSDDNNGVIGGFSGRIFRTADAGLTWTNIGLPGSDFLGAVPNIKQMQMVNQNLIYADEYRSTDGGSTWQLHNFDDNFIRVFHFFDPLFGYGIDDVKRVFRTVDGGLTWSLVNDSQLGNVSDFNKVYFDIGKVIGLHVNSDIYINSFDELLGTENSESTQAKDILLYPNPVADRLFVATKLELKSITLYDLQSRSFPVQLEGDSINMKSLPAGVYIIKMNTSVGTITKKVVKI